MQNRTQKHETPATLYEPIAPTDLRPEDLGGWMRPADEGADIGPGTFRIGLYTFDVRIWAEGAGPHWLTPPMKNEDRESLAASISEQGILDAITISHSGEVVDGYHRLSSWLTLVLAGHPLQPPPFRLVRFESAENEKSFVLAQNIARRHLSTQEKEGVLRQLLRDGHPGTDAWLAKVVGLHSETVKEIRATLENLPSVDVGIEFLEKRQSESGKTYTQKKAKPTTQKRRQEAKVTDPKDPQAKVASHDPKEGDKPTIEAEPIVQVEDEAADSTSGGVVDDNDQAESPVEKVSRPVVFPEEAETDDDLKLLVRDWWESYQFLPVLSKELADLQNKRTGAEEGPGDATRMTLMLKPKIGRAVGGHLILCRKLSANVSLFMLAPKSGMESIDLDWEALTTKAGSEEQKRKGA